MSPFAERNHSLAQLVAELRVRTGAVSDECSARHEASMGAPRNECAEPGVLLDVLFLDADRSTWVAVTNAALDTARSTPARTPSALSVRSATQFASSLRRLLRSSASSVTRQQRSLREIEAMGYPL